jgi:putative inorganic carbon (hco3(-)) transporter
MVLAIIVLITVLIMAIKGLSDPFMALMAFVTAYELQPGELYPALGSLHLELILLLFVLAVFAAKKVRFRYPPITKKLLAFYGAMLISTLFAFWRMNSMQFDFKFFEIVLYHLLLVSVLNSEERIRKYILLYAGLIAWIGASSLYEYHQGDFIVRMNIERAIGLTSAGGDPDTMALTMVVTLPFALLMLGKKTSKWLKLYGIAIFSIYLATIIETGSRTAFLAFIVFLLLFVFQRRRNWKFLPAVLLALPLLWMAIPQQYKARYETVETRDQDESYTDRILSWQGGIKMFLHNPLTGIGPDDYSDANRAKYWPEEPKHGLNAHSLYFKLLGELGIVGIFTFFAYVIAVIRMNWHLVRHRKEALLDPLVQRFPYACNLCFYLLFFSGYTSHNTYRSNWYTLGAITAAIALLKPATNASQATTAASPKRLPAWVPAKKLSEAEKVVA